MGLTLLVCQISFDFLRKFSDASSTILCLAGMLLCSLDDSVANEKLSLIAPISLIRFCFVLF